MAAAAGELFAAGVAAGDVVGDAAGDAGAAQPTARIRSIDPRILLRGIPRDKAFYLLINYSSQTLLWRTDFRWPSPHLSGEAIGLAALQTRGVTR